MKGNPIWRRCAWCQFHSEVWGLKSAFTRCREMTCPRLICNGHYLVIGDSIIDEEHKSRVSGDGKKKKFITFFQIEFEFHEWKYVRKHGRRMRATLRDTECHFWRFCGCILSCGRPSTGWPRARHLKVQSCCRWRYVIRHVTFAVPMAYEDTCPPCCGCGGHVMVADHDVGWF